MNKAVNFVPMNNIVNNSTRTDMTYANIVRNTSMENVTTRPSTNEKCPTQNEEWRTVQPKTKERYNAVATTFKYLKWNCK